MDMRRKIKKNKDLIFKLNTTMFIAVPILIIIIGIAVTYFIATSDMPDWLKFMLLR